jgi:hypothetical protein
VQLRFTLIVVDCRQETVTCAISGCTLFSGRCVSLFITLPGIFIQALYDVETRRDRERYAHVWLAGYGCVIRAIVLFPLFAASNRTPL